MKSRQNETIKFTLLIVLLIFCSNLSAVNKNNQNNVKPSHEKKAEILKNRLTLKEKISFTFIRKAINKYAKKAIKSNSEPKKKGLALASIILGAFGFLALILGFLVGVEFLILSGIIAAILALVSGLIGRKKAKKYPNEYEGFQMATIGAIFGGIVLLSILLVAAIIVGLFLLFSR